MKKVTDMIAEIQEFFKAAQESSLVESLTIDSDDQFSFKHKTDFGGLGCKVTVYIDSKSKAVVLTQIDPHNGNLECDDISLGGFKKYISPDVIKPKQTLNVEVGIKIQTEQLADLKTVLKKKVFKALVKFATKDNDKAKDGFDIVRGDDLFHFVKLVANGNVKID